MQRARKSGADLGARTPGPGISISAHVGRGVPGLHHQERAAFGAFEAFELPPIYALEGLSLPGGPATSDSWPAVLLSVATSMVSVTAATLDRQPRKDLSRSRYPGLCVFKVQMRQTIMGNQHLFLASARYFRR